jgi:2-keto-3-deoxy-L-rhamnonate aldolase RhmA
MTELTTNPPVRNLAKDKLSRDELVLSMSVRLVRSVEIAVIVKSSGFDVVRIDLEHGSFSLETTSQICIAALQSGVAPFVRVPALSPELIARVLDGGALGIIAPHIRNSADARQAVEYAKYPPIGRRSSGVSLPHLEYRSVKSSFAHPALNAATTVIALIESREGIANADAIAAVEGIDIVSIGTNDLCADLGIADQADHPLVDQAYMSVIQACRKHKKHSGVSGLASKPDLLSRYVKAGARFISLADDLGLLMNAAADRARTVRSMFRS